MANPIAVPSAPKPISNATAISAKPMVFLLNGQKLKNKTETIKKLMCELIFIFDVMCHSHINNGQHHKHERLQSNNQDMEHCPRPLQHTAENTDQQTCAKHGRNQNKNHFTCVHIPEQP